VDGADADEEDPQAGAQAQQGGLDGPPQPQQLRGRGGGDGEVDHHEGDRQHRHDTEDRDDLVVGALAQSRVGVGVALDVRLDAGIGHRDVRVALFTRDQVDWSCVISRALLVK
jgi:hypothetical protein